MPVPAPSAAVTVALEALAAQVGALQQAVLALRTTVVEDRPDQQPARADHKALRDLVQAVEDLADAVEAAVEAASAPLTGAAAGRRSTAVTGVHRALVLAGRLLRDELVQVGGRFDTARRVAAFWGPPWQAWTRVAQAGLADVAEALSAAEDAAVDAVTALLDPGAGPPGTDSEEALG